MWYHNVIFFAAGLIFFFIPGLYFVIGLHNPRFSRLWFFDPAQRKQYLVIAKRMFIWWISAGAFGIACALFWYSLGLLGIRK